MAFRLLCVLVLVGGLVSMQRVLTRSVLADDMADGMSVDTSDVPDFTSTVSTEPESATMGNDTVTPGSVGSFASDDDKDSGTGGPGTDAMGSDVPAESGSVSSEN